MYLNGIGVTKNDEEAFKWIRKAAEHESQTDAQRTLGNLYGNGMGTAKDEDEAAKWLRRANNAERFQKKLRSIIFQKLDLENVPLRKAVQYVIDESKRLDPDHEGIRIELRTEQEPEHGITLHLKDKVPLINAVKYVGSVSGVPFRFAEESVLIGSVAQIYPIETRTFAFSTARLRANRMDATEIKKDFEDFGIEFPEGTAIEYDAASGSLTVTHAAETLDAVGQILTRLKKVGAKK